jgi:CubicO group peptidase (beta-lactamase class C family)
MPGMHGSNFLKGLKRYTVIAHAQEIPADAGNYNTFLILLGKKSPRPDEISKIESLHPDLDIVFIVSDPLAYDYLPAIRSARTIVQTFKTNTLSYDILSQQIFGALPMMVSANRWNKSPDPDPLPGGLRLSFVPTSFLGINGALLAKRIDSMAIKALEEEAFPGFQVLASWEGQVFYHQTFGYHTYEHLRPVKHDDIYDLASVTKVSAATTAIMQLVDQGKFNIDEKLKTYMPDFKRSDKADLVWREILAHQARLKSWIPYWRTTLRKNGKFKRKTLKSEPSDKYPLKLTDQLYLHKDYKQKIYKAIRKSPLNEKSEFLYSGLSFYLYPEIVQNLSGQSFETFLKENIYLPLGAHTITFNPLRFYSKEQIIPTERDTFFRMIQIHGQVHDEGAAMMDGVSGNAGLFANAYDLAKLFQMFLNKGTYGGKRILNPETIDEFSKCQYCELGNRRGLGFDKPQIEFDPDKASVAQAASPSSFGHSGYTGTLVWADPESQLLFIFLSNRVYPTRLNRKIYEMGVRPGIHQILYDAIKR